MLTVEQVKSLDEKVRMALELIETLKAENGMLRGKLDEYKQRVEQLESVVDGFKLEQLEIEEGIKDVLTQLDQLEDQITSPDSSSKETTEKTENIPVVNTEFQNPSPTTEELSIASPSAMMETADKTEVFEEEKSEAAQTPELEIF